MSIYLFKPSDIFIDCRYLLVKKLGEGAFSEVYEVEDVETKSHMAMKLAFSQDDALSLEKEFEILSALKGSEGIVEARGLINRPTLETMRENGTVREKSR